VRNSAPRKLNVHDHSIGKCGKCGSKPPKRYTGRKTKDNGRAGLVCPEDTNCGTKDTHINFGEELDDIDWNEAERVCHAAQLCIVVGTSMSLRHVTHFPFMAERTVIINLQQTPDDDAAHLRIFAHADPVFSTLMDRLRLIIDPSPAPTPLKLPANLPLLTQPAPAFVCGNRKVSRATSNSTTRHTIPKIAADATRMRAHICQENSKINGSMTQVVALEMDPTTVGVSVRGRTVIRVIEGSQAAFQGVKIGWELTHVAGIEMPQTGKAAADAITKALAAGKRGGRSYEILFDTPSTERVKTPPLVVANLTFQKAGAATHTTGEGCFGGGVAAVKTVNVNLKGGSKTGTAFRAFSSGLGGGGMGMMEVMEAKESLLDLARAMEGMESASAC